MEYGGLFPLLYIFAGTANVLLIKWSDNQQAECSDGKLRHFQHPVVQTFLMFLGQFLCFVIYRIIYFFLQRRGNGTENYNLLTRGNSDYSKLSMLLPAFLDAIASVMLFTGLYLTYASSFQLIRTGLLIFGGIFSAIYMDQRLIARHWMALFTIACGIIVVLSIDVQRVSYDTASLPRSEVNAVLTGNLLILCAQVFHGAQYVYEEKHMKMHDIPPMHAAGIQGLFGLAITIIMALCLNYIPGFAPINENSRAVIDDLGDVLTQLRDNKAILGALIAFVFTSCAYNYIGLSITKASSMTNRVLTDCLRCLFVWIGAILVQWEQINLITVMGFIIVQMGIISYRNAIFMDWYRSFLARIQQRRYADLTPEAGDANVNSSSRPADVI